MCELCEQWARHFFEKKLQKSTYILFKDCSNLEFVLCVCDRHGATEEAADKRRQRNR